MEYLRFLTERMTTKQAYDFGYDAGLNGANTTNCGFTIFSSPENTKAWERGKAEGDKARKQK